MSDVQNRTVTARKKTSALAVDDAAPAAGLGGGPVGGRTKRRCQANRRGIARGTTCTVTATAEHVRRKATRMAATGRIID